LIQRLKSLQGGFGRTRHADWGGWKAPNPPSEKPVIAPQTGALFVKSVEESVAPAKVRLSAF